MSHLNEHEIQLLIENKSLEQEKNLHFQGCAHCKNIFKQQKEIHTKLVRIVPEKAPFELSKKILAQVSTLKDYSFNKNVKKHDWWFIGSLILLSLTSVYFVFIGGGSDKPSGNSGLMDTITKKINIDGLLSSISFPTIDFSFLYFLVLGVVAIAFYLFFDRYIQKFIYKFNQH